MPDVFDQIELDKPKDLFDEVGEAWKAEPLGPPEPPQYQPETAAPIPALVPVPPMPAPVPDGQFPLRFIPPVPLSPEQATARRMAAPSTLLPSIPEKYGAGVAQGFPFVQEFGPKVQETDPALLAAGKALVNVGLSLPEFATSPLGALTAAAGPIAPRVTSAAFSIDMLGGVLKQFPEVWDKWNTLSPARQVETGINLAAAIVMGGFLGKKAVTGWGKQPLGRPSVTQREAVKFAAELAERDPETFGQLAKEQVQKAVDVEQRQPTVPVVPVVTTPAPPAEKALSTAQIGKAWKGIQSNLDRSDLESLLAEWGDVELSQDGTRMFWIDQRAGGGKVPVTKADFLNWLRSDEAIAVSNDAEWQTLVVKAREAAGLPVIKTALTAPAAGETVKGVKPIKSYGERYIDELGVQKARERIDHLNQRTEQELQRRPIDHGAITRLQQEAQNIANALEKYETEQPAAPAAEPQTWWSSTTLEPGKAMYFSTLKSDADAYAIGRPSRQFTVEPKKTFDPAVSTDKALVKLFDNLGGMYEAPQNPRFVKALKQKGYDSVAGGETGHGGESKWLVVYDTSAVKEKGAEHALPIREAEKIPVEVPPGDRGAVGAQVREQTPAKPEEAEGPRPPEAPVLLTPPAAEAAKPAAPSTKAREAVPARTLKPDVRVRVLKAEELSAQALQKANELSEKGQKAKAEPFYQKSAQWLMRANELREDPKNYVEQPPPTPGTAAGGPISPGPGAAAAGTPGTDSAIRELADYIAALPPLKAPRKLSFAEKWAERLGRGKDLGTRVALRASAITESIKDSMRGVRRPTELGDSVAQLDFLLQRSAGESLRARTVLEKAIRNEDVRAALWLYADAKGDLAAIRDTLATMPADTKPAVRRALQIALRLPPEARNWLPFVEQFYGRKFAEAEAEGVLHEALPDYFTHVWKVKEDMPGSVQAALNSGKISEYFRYARERKLSTMLEGIKNPRMIPGMRLEPVLDAAKIIGHYNYALDRAIASRRFMERLSEMNATDGRPLVAPSGRAIPSEELKWAVINDTTGKADPFVKGIFDTEAEANSELARRGAGYHVEQRKNEFLMIKSRIKPEELEGYRPIDHPAMRKWQWAGTDATGKTTLYEGELLAHPEAYERLARFMDRSRLTPGKLTGGLLRYSGEVKAAKLGLLSTFHQVHVAKHALFHWTSPFRAPEIDWESPEVRFAIEKGHLKLAPEPGELNNFAEGILADEAIIHKLPIVGELSRRYSHYLFTDYIPRLKMATFANALERNRAIYGQTRGLGGAIKAFGAKPLSDAEIAARVGDSVNAAFGELNKLWLGKQGRDPRFQRALRMIFLAPDFGEARLRFVGKAFTKYGAEERFALAMNFATIYGLARVANWLATGDPHADDPKHWFDVKLGDHWYSMRSVMTDIAHLLAKPERFTRVRLNPGITEPLLEFISSRDWLGHTRTKGQQVEDYAKKFIPIAAQSLAEDDRHMWESFLGSMGIQPKRGDAVTEVHERAASYKEARGIQEPVEVQQAPSGNPYREGRIALEFNDPRRFWQAMQQQYAQLKLRNNPDPMGTIQAAFDRYYTKPFMGSERLEKDFVAQMNPRDRKLYTEARQEQALSSKKFHAWWDKWHDYMLTGHRTGI